MKTIEQPRKKLERIWRNAWRPPDRRPPWAWCEDHITSIPYSPIPGRFRSANSPWMREPMEALVDPRIRIVSIIAAIQSGKTSVGEFGLCHIIANHPGPTLWLDQTDDDAKDQSESRLQKLFDECQPVRALYPANRHKRRNTTIHFANGMTLWVLGAHNKTNLQRRSIRWLVCDETWRYPTGHMAEAEARVTAFGWLGKCLFMSQGGEEDDDTHRKYETTDMREWTFACPHLGDKRATYTHKVKGRKSVERFYSPRRKVVLGRGQSCSVFYWSNLNIKDTLARLRRNQDRDNGPVWEVPDDIIGFVFTQCAPWPQVVRASFDGQAFRESALIFCGDLTPADFKTAFKRLEDQSRELEAAQVDVLPDGGGKK